MNKKILYTYIVHKEVESEIREASKDSSGNDIEVIKKIKEQRPIDIIVYKPSKRQMDDAKFEYGKHLNRLCNDGFLTRAMLAKKYSDIGGALSQDQLKTYNSLYLELEKVRDESVRIGALKETRKELQKDWEELRKRDRELRDQIISIESSLRNLFEHTADTKAEAQAILWLALHLAFIKEDKDKEAVAYFKGDDFAEKLEDYYEKEEDETNLLHAAIRDKLFLILSFWYYGGATDQKDFEFLEEELKKSETKEAE